MTGGGEGGGDATRAAALGCGACVRERAGWGPRHQESPVTEVPAGLSASFLLLALATHIVVLWRASGGRGAAGGPAQLVVPWEAPHAPGPAQEAPDAVARIAQDLHRSLGPAMLVVVR